MDKLKKVTLLNVKWLGDKAGPLAGGGVSSFAVDVTPIGQVAVEDIAGDWERPGASDARIRDLEAANTKLLECVGLASTAVPNMEINVDDPLGMMHRVVREAAKSAERIRELEAALAAERRRRSWSRKGVEERLDNVIAHRDRLVAENAALQAAAPAPAPAIDLTDQQSMEALRATVLRRMHAVIESYDDEEWSALLSLHGGAERMLKALARKQAEKGAK